MTPNELPAQPRKPSRKRWILASACVLAIALGAPVLKGPTSEPFSIWYVRSTNYNGMKMLLFEGTNGTPDAIRYLVRITTNLTISPFPKNIPNDFNIETSVRAGAGESFTFSFVAPPNEAAWRVAWTSARVMYNLTPGEVRRYRWAVFLNNHGMRALAWRISPWTHLHYIDATDIKQ